MQSADRNLLAWASDTLLRQGMPACEFRSMLRADDFQTVRRHLELHRERLAERLSDHLRAVDRVERLLRGILEHPQAIGAPSSSAQPAPRMRAAPKARLASRHV